MSQPGATPTIDQPDTHTSVDEIFSELTGYKEKLNDGGEKDRFSHYVTKEDIIRASTQGIAVYALCGKKWKPSRDPQRYPVCKTCEEIYLTKKPGDDE